MEAQYSSSKSNETLYMVLKPWILNKVLLRKNKKSDFYSAQLEQMINVDLDYRFWSFNFMLDLLKQNEINVYKTQIISKAIETTEKQKRGMKRIHYFPRHKK